MWDVKLKHLLTKFEYVLQGEEVEFVAADDFEESDVSDIEVSVWLN